MKPEELLAHADFVRDLARSLVPDEHAAADLSQDAYLTALERPPASHGKLRSWFAVVTRNFWKKRLRSEQRRWRREGAAAVPDIVPSTEEIVEREEIRRIVVDSVLSLAEPYRSTILLRFYENMPPRQIAQHFEVPTETVRTRLKKGLALLGNQLDEIHHGDRRKWQLALLPAAGWITAQQAAAGTGTGLLSWMAIMSMKMKVSMAVALIAVVTASLIMVFSDPAEKEQETPSDNSAEVLTGSDPDGNQDDEATSSSTFITNQRLKLVNSEGIVRLSGRILNRSDASPIVGAKVRVKSLPFRKDFPEWHALSASDGSFDLKVSATDRLDFYFHVTAEGFKDLETSYSILAANTPFNCGNLYLAEDVLYRLVIVDEGVNPIPGANLSIFKDNAGYFRLDKTSNSEGEVVIKDSELVWGHWMLNRMTLRVTAPGKSDFYTEFKSEDKIPRTIVMKPEFHFSGRVIDKESEAGIANATLFLRKLRWSVDSPVDLYEISRVETDRLGWFRMKGISAPGVKWRIHCFAEHYGYEAVFFREDLGFPESIHLTRLNTILVDILVLDGHTSKALPGFDLMASSVTGNIPVSTDDSGFFRCPLLDQGETMITIEAKGYKKESFNIDPQASESDARTIRLQPLNQQHQDLRIIDELGRPVSGAHSSIGYPYEGRNYTQDTWTDASGHARFNLLVKSETQASIKVDCPGYCQYRIEEFPLGLKQQHQITVTLKRGFLFQNLHVVDGKAEPITGAQVQAELTTEDGKTMRLYCLSDGRGYCALSFPRFKDGSLFVYKRPDTKIKINYEQLLRGDKILLVVYENMTDMTSVHGIVQDSSGSDLDGICIYYYEMYADKPSSGYRYMGHVSSKKDGSFQVPAFADRLYKLKFSLQRNGDRFLVADEVVGVSAGADLLVSMRAFTGVQVMLFPIYKEEDLVDLSYDTWLETAEGVRLQSKEIKKGSHMVFFLNPPTGIVRTIVETKSGRRFKTPMFKIEAEKCVTTQIDLDL